MQHPEVPGNVYGEIMQEKHTNCRDSVVLIQTKNIYRCGLIVACGDNFCYVLTTKDYQLSNCKSEIIITFGDETEKSFHANDVVVESGNTLSILVLRDVIGTVWPAREPVRFRNEFSSENDLEEALVYTLSYIPKASTKYGGGSTASSYFRGGNPGVVGVFGGKGVFYHNCSTGSDVIKGSAVFNGNRYIIGINLEYSTGWIKVLRLTEIKEEITQIFPDTRDMAFAGIKHYMEAKG